MCTQTLGLLRNINLTDLQESAPSQKNVFRQKKKCDSWDNDVERLLASFYQVRTIEKSTSRVLLTFILCTMMLSAQSVLPTCK